MTCAKCGYACEWYAPWWSEVMERKLSDKDYLCRDCYNVLADEAFEKWKKDFRKKKKGWE